MAKFTKMNIGDTVASSGGRVWKKLSADSITPTLTLIATPSSVFLVRDVISTAVSNISCETTGNISGSLILTKKNGPTWASLDGTTLTFTIDSSVQTAVYTVTVTGNYGGLTAEVTVTANVYAIS